jgi:hypothetical protein
VLPLLNANPLSLSVHPHLQTIKKGINKYFVLYFYTPSWFDNWKRLIRFFNASDKYTGIWKVANGEKTAGWSFFDDGFAAKAELFGRSLVM